MDDERAVDEEGEDALYEYLFGHEAAVSWEEGESHRFRTQGPWRRAQEARGDR